MSCCESIVSSNHFPNFLKLKQGRCKGSTKHLQRLMCHNIMHALEEINELL